MVSCRSRNRGSRGSVPTLVEIEYLDFEINCPSAWEVSNVGRSGTVGFAADARGGVSGPRGAEVGGRVRRSGLRRRHRVHWEHRVPAGAAVDGARGGRGARRRRVVRAGLCDAARRVAGARDHGGGDRQGARAQGVLHSERWFRVQPGADHRRPGSRGARAGGVLAGPRAGAGAVGRAVGSRHAAPLLDSPLLSPDRNLDRLVPKLVTTLKAYTREQCFADAVAGVIVGIVALPLAIAFAIASGVTPERGLFTAIVAGFLISALGGSRVQIGGPTGAFVVIVYA